MTLVMHEFPWFIEFSGVAYGYTFFYAHARVIEPIMLDTWAVQ